MILILMVRDKNLKLERYKRGLFFFFQNLIYFLDPSALVFAVLAVANAGAGFDEPFSNFDQ